MTMTTNAENLRQYKSRFSLTVDTGFRFELSNLVRDVKSLSPNFKRIA